MAISTSQARGDVLWHRLGMGLSALCLIHCLALPWLLASLPLVTLAAMPEALRESEWLHAGLIGPVLMVSGPALLRGRPRRSQTGLALAGFAALIGGLLVASEMGERALTVTGATLLMAAHGARLRSRHSH